jgi:hypothetical protein
MPALLCDKAGEILDRTLPPRASIGTVFSPSKSEAFSE